MDAQWPSLIMRIPTPSQPSPKGEGFWTIGSPPRERAFLDIRLSPLGEIQRGCLKVGMQCRILQAEFPSQRKFELPNLHTSG